MTRSRRRPRPPTGYTLVELMMTASILALVALMAAPLMVQSTRFFLLTRAKVEIQRDARQVMETITKALRQAQSNTLVIDRADANQPFYSRLRFTTINGASHTFFQSGNQLRHTSSAGTKALSTNVRFMSFYFPRSNDMSIISVSLTFEKGTYEGKTKALHVASERVRVMN
ncbi:MAG: prepilin-type N-terminal cleavage/methylation domain-containing protein [Elusimicrobia bacterium]|nr:prepilin-type N-terminal cleavage/methylation domain-containing protein [Elusimicrobiota bacterium]MBK9923408.1 prepilin-type N-terminal cleavage/methylation domain-containing protein [Elusimicrobiota bacterium]